MIKVKREYRDYLAKGGYKDYVEFKFFHDDDVQGIQKYVDENGGIFDFERL